MVSLIDKRNGKSMLINIKEMGKKAGAVLPDLLTRPIAKKVLSLMLDKIAMAGAEELVICDFSGIEVVDPSFVDECLISLLKRSMRESRFHVMLRNLSKIAEENIEGVIKLHNENSDEKVSILTEQLTCSNTYLIGELSNLENEVIAFLRINGFASVSLLTSLFPLMSESELRMMLNSMQQRGLIRNADNKIAGYSSV